MEQIVCLGLIAMLILYVIRAVNSYDDEISIVPRQTTSCTERNTPGLICESCDRLAFCVKTRGKWETYPVEPCDVEKGYFCNLYEGKCSNTPGSCNRLGYEGNFPCTSDGIFPDPYDCQIYHMCYHAQPETNDNLPIAGTAKCGGNKAYSVNTCDCSLTIADNVCKERQYKCEQPGDTSPWPGNPNIFYICQPEVNKDGISFLYPTLYRCAPGEIYNRVNCIEGNGIRTTWQSTIYTASGVVTHKSTTKNSEGDICNNEIGLKADPIDCHSYYHCSSKNGSPKRHTCPVKTYFNVKTSSCMFGEC